MRVWTWIRVIRILGAVLRWLLVAKLRRSRKRLILVGIVVGFVLSFGGTIAYWRTRRRSRRADARSDGGSSMSLGPIEMLVVKFPGNQFKGEIAPELKRLVESGTIRVVDILFMQKDQDGVLSVVELNDLDDDNFARFDPVVTDLTGLLGHDDVEQFSTLLESNSSAAIMLFENTWATRFRDAVANANGQLVFSERIPKVVIDELLTAAAV